MIRGRSGPRGARLPAALPALAVGFLVPVAVTATAATPPPLRSGEILYPVHQGDTLYHLASRYLSTPRAIIQVRRLNRVTNVHRLPAGGFLRIPRDLLRDEPSPARIDTFSGEVVLRPAGAAPVAASPGAALTEGMVIETGRRGFLSLRLADDSTVTIPSQSTVQVVRLRRILINGAVEREFRALSGRVRARVTPMSDPASTFRVGTPITVSAVRGTEFRVAYDRDGARALTEVEDGKVAFALAQPAPPTPARPGPSAPTPVPPTPVPAAPTLLAPGFGAVARPGDMGAATALLPPPRLVAPDRAQTEPQLGFALEPAPSAAGYRVQIGRDAGLLDLVDEANGPEPRFAFAGLPTGTYFIRIAALDANGAEGLGRTYAFDRVLNAVAGTANPEGRRFRFKWSSVTEGRPQFRFRLLRQPEPGAPSPPPVVDEPMGTATEIAITGLRPGQYSWQVLSLVPFGARLVGTWSAPQQFEVAGRR